MPDMHSPTRVTLASIVAFPMEVAIAAQMALAAYPETHPYLAQNKGLCIPAWRKLWGPKRPDSGLAASLVARALPRPERDLVIRRETRITVLKRFLDHNLLDPEEQREVATRPSPGLAANLVGQPWLLDELRKPLATIAGGLTLLEELAYATEDEYSDAEITTLLVDFESWGPEKSYRQRAALLKLLFSRRPGVISPVLAAVPISATGKLANALLPGIAGAAHLTDDQVRTLVKVDDTGCNMTPAELAAQKYLLLALVANPTTCLEVVRTIGARGADLPVDVANGVTNRLRRPEISGPISGVDDPDAITWLLRRALPSDEYHTPGRPWEFIELVRNPHLDGPQREKLALWATRTLPSRLLGQYAEELKAHQAELCNFENLEVRQRNEPLRTAHASNPYGEEDLIVALEPLGDNAQNWETLIGLVEQHTGPLKELVDVTLRL